MKNIGRVVSALMVLIALLNSASGQNVGIGTTSPASKLDVSGGLTVGASYAGTNSAPSNGAIFEGNVGIGTVLPSVALDVNGQIRMRLGATNGFIPVSDANGVMTWTDPATLFSGNTLDGAYDQGGSGIGRLIIADAGTVSIQGTDGFEVTGTFASGDTILTTSGVRMFFNPRKAAFRAGTTSNSAWDHAYVGDYSFAAGLNTYATGSHSVSMGAYNFASGNYSAAFGYHTYTTNTHAFGAGSNNNATGAGSVVLGSNSTTSGSGSVSLGAYNDVAGNYSIANGYNNIVGGAYSVAMGRFNSVHFESNVAMGSSNTIFGKDAHAYGYGLTNNSFNEILVGRYNTVIPAYSQSTWDGRDRIFTIGNGASSASRSTAMVVLQNGKVGIGTVSPVELLDVRGSALFNEDGGDNDFRIEGDNKTHLFFADASVDRIGIGNSAPLFDLHVGDGTLTAINTADTRIVSSNDANQNRAAFLALARDVGGNRIEAQFEADGQFNDAVIFGAATSHPVHFRTGNFTRMSLSTTGNLGIGTTAPDVRLHVATGTDVAVTGGGFIQLGASTGANIGMDNNEIMARNNGATSILHIQTNGGYTAFGDRVGIETTAPATTLHVNHPLGITNGLSISNQADVDRWHWYVVSSNELNLYFNNALRGTFNPTTGVYSTPSDKRLKTDIQSASSVINRLLELPIYSYSFIHDDDRKKHMGVLAQEAQNYFPELVNQISNTAGEEQDLFTVDYAGFSMVAIKAIQEQQQLIEDQYNRLTTLEAEVKDLRQLVEQR